MGEKKFPQPILKIPLVMAITVLIAYNAITNTNL